MMITERQRRCIWGLARRLGLEEELLRNAVESISGQRHISRLTKDQAADLIDFLQKLISPHIATPGQVWKIRDLARRLGWNNYRLRRFLEVRWGVSRPEWLPRDRAWKVIEALKAMLKREAQDDEGVPSEGAGQRAGAVGT